MSLDFSMTARADCCKTVQNTFHQNYTHNGGEFADILGIYFIIWHAQEMGLTAGELIKPIKYALLKFDIGETI